MPEPAAILWRELSLSDRETVGRFARQLTPVLSAYCFTTLFQWSGYNSALIADTAGGTVIRLRVSSSDRYLYLVICSSDRSEELIPSLRRDASGLGVPLRLITPSDKISQLPAIGQTVTVEDPDVSEYVYLRDDLERLHGERLASKRNHLQRFKRSYDWTFRPMSPADADECMELERRWLLACCTDAPLAEADAIGRAFSNFAALGIVGGTLWVDGRLVAFSYGTRVSQDTFCVHIEKADRAFEGAYAAINNMLVMSLDPDIIYVNREEDLGLPGLRKAKRSYCPCMMAPNRVSMELAGRLGGIFRLWSAVFGDPDDIIGAYLARYYSPSRTMTYEDESGRVVAMAHVIPFSSSLGRGAYVYAVATDPARRCCGIATSLLERAAEWGRQHGFDYMFLIPADAALAEWYRRRGYDGGWMYVSFSGWYDFGTGDPASDRAVVMWLSEARSLPEREPVSHAVLL